MIVSVPGDEGYDEMADKINNEDSVCSDEWVQKCECSKDCKIEKNLGGTQEFSNLISHKNVRSSINTRLIETHFFI